MVLTTTDISQLYVTIFNRASEQGGNDFWKTVQLPPGSEQELKAFTADEMLLTGSALEYFGDTLGDSPEQHQAFIEVIYLNTFNQTYAQDPGGIEFWASVLDGGESHGTVVNEIIKAVLGTPGTPNTERFNNRVEISDYAALTITQFDPQGVIGGPIETGLTFYGQGEGNLVVTDADYTVVDAKSDIDKIPFIYEFTEADDNITGRAGDDTVVATLIAGIESAPDTGTLNDADVYSPNGGSDTLALTTNIANFATSSIPDGVDVNKLELISGNASDPGADVVWESINFDKDFDEVILDMGLQIYDSEILTITSIPTSTAVTLKNLRGNADNNLIKAFSFETSIEEVDSVDLTFVGSVNAPDKLRLNSTTIFDNATHIDINYTIKDFNNDIGNSFFYKAIAPNSLTLNTILNIENVSSEGEGASSDFRAGIGFEGTGSAVLKSIINISDTNNTRAYLYNSGTSAPTSDRDVVTVNLANIKNTAAQTQVVADDFETLNVNVLANSELEFIDVGNDIRAGVDATVNVNLNVDTYLKVSIWELRETNGDTSFNITGAGDLSIQSLVSAANKDFSEVSIDGSTATGDLLLGIGQLNDDTGELDSGLITDSVVSILTGSGEDTVIFNAPFGVPDGLDGTARIQTNGGGDYINVNTGTDTIVYTLASDSQAIFSEEEDETGALQTFAPGIDVIKGFNGVAGADDNKDTVELGASLNLAFANPDGLTGIVQKGSVILGSDAFDLQYY
ncbi:MAG: hypothetical protein GQ582_08490, partial [Methyloprofundus sp.]|nr:hypothetical protein [Methyloprofundus sp.]